MNINKVAILFQSTNKVPIEIEERHYATIRQTLPGVEIIRAYDEEELISKTDDADVLLTWGQYKPVKFCTKAKSLKWIHAISAGVEGVTTPEISALEAKISSTKGIHGIPMAEHTMAFILSFLRLFPLYGRQQQTRVWLKHKECEETTGKTVGIIGLGSIGKEVAKKAKLFGMRVVATKRIPVECEWVDQLYSENELEKLLAESDFVVVIVPLTPETVKLIGEKELRMMKQSAYLINIGRGPIVDEQALVKILEEGVIAGAGLDVVEVEPLPSESPLWNMSNVIITPHTSADSPLYMDRAIKVFCENLRRLIAGEELLYEVMKNKGY